MQTIHSLALSLAGALLLPGCFESMPEPLPLASTFEVLATLSFEYGGPGSELPESALILLRLDGDADADVAAMFTTTEGSASGAFVRAGSGIALRDAVAVPILSRPGTDDARLTMESIDLAVLDHDGDGSADAVEGSGIGTYAFLVGDVEFRESFTVEMSGELDDGAP